MIKLYNTIQKKKITLAGSLTQNEATRQPNFNYAADQERVRNKSKGNASTSLWNNQHGIAKPKNTGKMDPYARIQDKLSSNISESTDFS